MKTYLLIGIACMAGWGLGMTAKAAQGSAEFDTLFSTLEQQPGLNSDDIAKLEKAKSMISDLKGKGVWDQSGSMEEWNEYMQLRDTLSGLSKDMNFQLSLGLLAPTDDDYVNEAAVLSLTERKLDVQSSQQLIDILLLMDKANAIGHPVLSNWLSPIWLKVEVGKMIYHIFHIPPDSENFLQSLWAKGSAPSWLLKTLELAKTLPANQGNLALIDADIAYIKERSAPPQTEASPPPAPITSAAPASTAPVAAPSPTVVEASPGESAIPLWIYGVVPLSIGCIVGIGFLFLRGKK
jgi:hypothetical protein